MSNLTGQKIKNCYDQFLITDNAGGLNGTLTPILSGTGASPSALELSTSAVNIVSGFQLDSVAVTSTAAELNYLDLVASIGDATASKAVVLDANKDFDFGTGDVTCTDLDVEGTLTVAAISVSNLTLSGDLTVSGGDIFGPENLDLNIKSDGNMNFFIDFDPSMFNSNSAIDFRH